MEAREFLKGLTPHSSVFDANLDYEYTEDQLILFAELYHKKEITELNVKADHYDKIQEGVNGFYLNEDEESDLVDIGEWIASYFNWI